MFSFLSLLMVLFPFPWAAPFHSVQPAAPAALQVRYLGANGWAVTVGRKVLIFDYQETTDPNPPALTQRNLAHGYVDPEELKNSDVYVFVTHSHFDHYHPVIHEWARRLSRIHYVFGWKAGNDPTHNYLAERRARARIGDVEVHTIYSHANDVPEVAFLVRVGDLVVYDSGDYRADYEADFRFLRTITDHIDVAFLIGHAFPEHQHFRQALRMNELFRVGHIFPMNREGQPQLCHDYARLLEQREVSANIHVLEKRGDVITLNLRQR